VYLLEELRERRRTKKKTRDSIYTGSIIAKKLHTTIIPLSIHSTLPTRKNYNMIFITAFITVMAVFAKVAIISSNTIPPHVTCSFSLASYQSAKQQTHQL
jgi:hypothetical protein